MIDGSFLILRKFFKIDCVKNNCFENHCQYFFEKNFQNFFMNENGNKKKNRAKLIDLFGSF